MWTDAKVSTLISDSQYFSTQVFDALVLRRLHGRLAPWHSTTPEADYTLHSAKSPWVRNVGLSAPSDLQSLSWARSVDTVIGKIMLSSDISVYSGVLEDHNHPCFNFLIHYHEILLVNSS